VAGRCSQNRGELKTQKGKQAKLLELEKTGKLVRVAAEPSKGEVSEE